MINYIIATWAGDKRRNPSTEYLKFHLDRLFALQHNLANITIVRPLGSDCDEFYELPAHIADKVTILHRPANDRSYGQFLWAFDKTPKCDFFILAEDDYIPVVDHFDSILENMLYKNNADYVCGRYHNGEPEMNIGIVRAEAMEKIAGDQVQFHVNGTNDGDEKVMFAKMFTDNGLKIADYSDEYAVPYWDRYLRYLTPNKGQALFEPFQKLAGKAFTYEWDRSDTPADLDSHFLMNMELKGWQIFIDGAKVGAFYESGDNFEVYAPEQYQKQVSERLRYINRYREIFIYFK